MSEITEERKAGRKIRRIGRTRRMAEKARRNARQEDDQSFRKTRRLQITRTRWYRSKASADVL